MTLLNVSPGAERQAWRHRIRNGFGPEERLEATAAHRQPAARRDVGLVTWLVCRSCAYRRLGSPSALPGGGVSRRGNRRVSFETGEELRGGHDATGSIARGRPDPTTKPMLDWSWRDPRSDSAAVGGGDQERRPDIHAFSNEQIVARVSENGFAYFRQISVVLSSITLAFAFLLVATLLTVSVNQRLGRWRRCARSVCRAGGSRRRCSGNPAAGRRGWVAARCRSAGRSRRSSIASCRDMPGIPERVHFFVFEPHGGAASRAAGGDRRGRRGLSGLDRDPAADSRDPSTRDHLMTPIVEARDFTRTFPMPSGPVTALREVSIRSREGEYVAITGPSGCGKSTLLHLLGCVDTPTGGSLLFEGHDASRLRSRRAAASG